MPLRALRNKTLHFILCSASKEENLVEVAVTHQVRLLRRQSGVLHQLPGREGLQWHDGHMRFLSQLLQCLGCPRLWLRDRHARESAKSQRLRRTQVEIALRKVHAAASFRDEGMVMAQLSA